MKASKWRERNKHFTLVRGKFLFIEIGQQGDEEEVIKSLLFVVPNKFLKLGSDQQWILTTQKGRKSDIMYLLM